MAEIPSDIASSAAQSGIRAKVNADAREAGRTSSANAADRQARAIEEAGSTVDTDDADNRAFADAEGAGSQGRSDDEALPSEPDDSQSSVDDGVTTDKDGSIHLDLEA